MRFHPRSSTKADWKPATRISQSLWTCSRRPRFLGPSVMASSSQLCLYSAFQKRIWAIGGRATKARSTLSVRRWSSWAPPRIHHRKRVVKSLKFESHRIDAVHKTSPSITYVGACFHSSPRPPLIRSRDGRAILPSSRLCVVMLMVTLAFWTIRGGWTLCGLVRGLRWSLLGIGRRWVQTSFGNALWRLVWRLPLSWKGWLWRSKGVTDCCT